MTRVGEVRFIPLLTVLWGIVGVPGVRAADDPAVDRGVQYLRSALNTQGIGETALAVLAMIKAGVPQDDPAVADGIGKLRSRFTSGVYQSERSGGTDIYEAAVVGMALTNLPAESRRAELDMVARFLAGRQNPNGSWDYTGRQQGDTSISQFAVLGLWEAENGGADVSPRVWDRAANWFLSVQSPGGSWNYHRDELGKPETIAMTAAGVGSLLICRRQLAEAVSAAEAPNPHLLRLTPGGQRGPYTPRITAARIDQAVQRGLAWLASHFTTSGGEQIIGPTVYYALYGIERVGALADRETIGRLNWYEQGRSFILATQRPDGSWSSSFGDPPNTSWAIFFLTRSTAQTIRKIEFKKLGAGTLLGGRGLPKDLTSVTVAAGRVVSRPMNGAVEGMLAALEDPRSQDADAALSGLVARYQTQGPDVLRPHKDRFRKLLTDRDPGLRRVAAWALGRTGDLDAAPALIAALTDPDENVVATARLGLQLISRKIDGLGPPSPSTLEQRQEAARKWQGWYDANRPFLAEGQEDGATGAEGPR